MADFDPIVRDISGNGIIKIPAEWEDALQVSLYVQLRRDVKTPYVNKTFNPDKGFYAHVCFCYEDFVLHEFDVNFKQQMFLIHQAQESQNLLSLICAYDGVLDSFVSIGNAVGTVISRVNRIKEHPYLRFVPNNIRFSCFATCALRLTLKGIKLEKCALGDGTPTPPPPPPPPVPPANFDEPILVDPPYPNNGDPSDPDTFPSPLDEDKPPEQPLGVLYDIVLEARKIGTGDLVQFFGQAYSPIISASQTCDTSGDIISYSVGIIASGIPSTGYTPGQTSYYSFGGGSGGGTGADCFSDARIVSVTPVPS